MGARLDAGRPFFTAKITEKEPSFFLLVDSACIGTRKKTHLAANAPVLFEHDFPCFDIFPAGTGRTNHNTLLGLALQT